MLHHYAFKNVGQDAAADRFERSAELQRLADPTTVHQPTGKQHFGNDRQSASWRNRFAPSRETTLSRMMFDTI